MGKEGPFKIMIAGKDPLWKRIGCLKEKGLSERHDRKLSNSTANHNAWKIGVVDGGNREKRGGKRVGRAIEMEVGGERKENGLSGRVPEWNEKYALVKGWVWHII